MNAKSTGQGDKYFTEQGQLTELQIRDHLDGTKTLGATLLHPFKTTRLFRFDADNQDQLQLCREEAVHLASLGFLPVIEVSPVRDGSHAGGGSLWILFDGYVGRDRAYQSLVTIAPRLNQMECFPTGGTGQTRLPAGRYVKKGFSEWCKFYDEAGNELSHDGWSGAAALLNRQTSRSLLKKYAPSQALSLQSQEVEIDAAREGGSTWLPSLMHQSSSKKGGCEKEVIAQFNATYSWDKLIARCGGWHGGFFYCIWRGDKNRPNGTISEQTGLAKDWVTGEYMDKYDVYCRLEGGDNWQVWKMHDLAVRCEMYRAEQLMSKQVA